MEALIFHPQTKEQLSALKAFAKALKVPFEEEKRDETAYLSKSKANKKALDKSIEQAENGQTVNIALDELWK